MAKGRQDERQHLRQLEGSFRRETTLDVRIGPFEYELISRDVGCEQRIVIEVETSLKVELNSLSRLWGEGGQRPGEGEVRAKAQSSLASGLDAPSDEFLPAVSTQ